MKPKEILLASFALVIAALPAAGDIVAGFSNTFSPVVDQYPGIGGDGWEAGWGRTASGSQPVLAIQNTSPIGAGGNYLKITSNATSDNAFGRRFVGGPVDTTLPHTLTFDVRIDSLTGWATGNDYLSIHGTRSTSTFNVSADSSFIFRAFGASPGNSNEAVPTALHAKEWLLYNSTATRAGYSAMPLRIREKPKRSILDWYFSNRCFD